MASFLDVRGVLVKQEFVVQCNPKIFETVHFFTAWLLMKMGCW